MVEALPELAAWISSALDAASRGEYAYLPPDTDLVAILANQVSRLQ